MKRNLDLGLLRTLICISETGSMSGAAQRLYVTQGAVSHQVKRLEQLLDQRLLERGNDGVRLSDAGLRLVSEGRELLRMHDELLASFTVASVTGGCGSVCRMTCWRDSCRRCCRRLSRAIRKWKWR
jgi:molybdate transport repressor ModE-like protein